MNALKMSLENPVGKHHAANHWGVNRSQLSAVFCQNVTGALRRSGPLAVDHPSPDYGSATPLTL
jgi:hypothetical protein